MTVLGIGISYGLATLFAMFSGMPIAFALGAVAVVFMGIYMPGASLDTVTQNVYEEMASITLLSIPLFILKGAAIGKSRAGQDLYSALHAWLHRVPGGLGVANVFACALFAAMAGSSPATCSAIGSAGIPEMRKRGYSGGFAAGIIAAGGTLGILLPPSITMILFAVAAEKSLGRLFLAGIGPGLLLVSLFGAYAVIRFRREYAAASALYAKTGATSAILTRDDFTMAERFNVLPRVLPFVLLLTGVMIALYGGYATPSETAGLGGLLALDSVTFNIRRGEILGLIGPNGAGKTTCFNAISGVYRPSGGTVIFDGAPLGRIKRYQITRRGIARTFQNIRLWGEMTALENVVVGTDARHKTSVPGAIIRSVRHRREERDAIERAAALLHFVGIAHRGEEKAKNLPYGDQRRLEIARALATEPKLLCLDEPAAGFNAGEKAALIELINKIRDDGYTVLLIEHDMRLVMGVTDRIVVLEFGRKIAEGVPPQIREDPAVIAAYLGVPDDDA